ncbi:MAG: hypothetical protein AVDCRST_MAG89-3218, partial [uncultured Gemmatimonadetes bacterium]
EHLSPNHPVAHLLAAVRAAAAGAGRGGRRADRGPWRHGNAQRRRRAAADHAGGGRRAGNAGLYRRAGAGRGRAGHPGAAQDPRAAAALVLRGHAGGERRVRAALRRAGGHGDPFSPGRLRAAGGGRGAHHPAAAGRHRPVAGRGHLRRAALSRAADGRAAGAAGVDGLPPRPRG